MTLLYTDKESLLEALASGDIEGQIIVQSDCYFK